MKIKTTLIVLSILFVSILFVKIKLDADKISRQRSEIERLNNNWYNSIKLANENKTLYLKEKDLKEKAYDRLKHSRDSIAKANRIRKKDVLNITYHHISLHLASPVSVPTKPIAPNVWSFTDTINKCTVYKGEVTLTDNNILVKRTGFDEDNVIEENYFRKAPFVWFIRVGKFENYVERKSRCGNTYTEQFEFTGKRNKKLLAEDY